MEMDVGDIKQLKSGGRKIEITWVVGENPEDIFQIDEVLKRNIFYREGDVTFKYMRDQEKPHSQINRKCLCDDTEKDLVPAKDDKLKFGCVVESKLDCTKMTVLWVIGKDIKNPKSFLDFNKLGIRQYGLDQGDVSCGWFDEAGNYKTGNFKASSLRKLFE